MPSSPRPPTPKPAGYKRFAGAFRRMCLDALRKARSRLPGLRPRPPGGGSG
jgi:hypothetical protein